MLFFPEASFVLFEWCVGIYFPCISTVKSRVVPDSVSGLAEVGLPPLLVLPQVVRRYQVPSIMLPYSGPLRDSCLQPVSGAAKCFRTRRPASCEPGPTLAK